MSSPRILSLRLQLLTVAAIFAATGVADLAAAAPAKPAARPAAAAAPAASGHPNLSGFWEPMSDSMKPAGKPAFTARALKEMAPDPNMTPGQATWAKNGIGEDDANCLPRRQPWMLTQSAPISIAHDGDQLVLLYEKRSAPMHVYIDGRKHPAPGAPGTINGHSVGHWEGDELVVDSVNFADHPGHGPLNDLPFLPSTRIELRLRLQNSGQELRALFTIEDPQLFEKPYVYEFTWHRLPYETNYALIETCDARDPARLQY